MTKTAQKRFFNKTLLPSGMKILTETIPEVRSVALGFWVRIGSRDEPPKLAGMSHFLEHLLFKGTKTRSAREISETFDSLGGELNAYTTKEHTCFYSRLLDEHLAIGVEVLADILQNPLFKKKDIESERQVILEEINLYEDSPDERIHDILAATLLKEHSLGKPVLGSARSVKAFSRKDVTQFYSHGYHPNNIVVTAAGSLKHQGIVDLLERFFTAPKGEKIVRKNVQPKHNSQVKVVRKKTEQAHLCVGLPGLTAGHKDRFILTILDKILGGGMSSRLFQEIREKRGLAYSIYSYHAFYTETGLMAVYAGTRPQKAKEVATLIKAEIEKIGKSGVSPKELRRAKEHLKGELVLDLENTAHRMARLGQSELAHGEILSLDELVNRIDSVTTADAKRLAREIFNPEKMAIAVIGPVKEEDFESNLVERGS